MTDMTVPDAQPVSNPQLLKEDALVAQEFRRRFEQDSRYAVESRILLAVASQVTGRPPRAHERRLRGIMHRAFPDSAPEIRRHLGTGRQRRVWRGIRLRHIRPLHPQMRGF